MSLRLPVQVFLDQVEAAGPDRLEDRSIDDARAVFETFHSLGDAPEAVEHVSDTAIGPVPVRVYRPRRVSGPVVLWIHGGGWIVGSLESADRLCRALANASGAVVVSVGYRLAPEHAFPAALEDCWAVLCTLPQLVLDWGGDPARIVVGGHDVGAAMAAVMCLMARGGQGPAIAQQILVAPITRVAAQTASRREFGSGYLLTEAALQRAARVARVSPDDWRASPLLADSFADLPPALVYTCEYDPLRDEGEAFAAALVAGGGFVMQRRWLGQIHGFWAQLGLFEDARLAIDEIAAVVSAAARTEQLTNVGV